MKTPFKPFSNYIICRTDKKDKIKLALPDTVKKDSGDFFDLIVIAVSDEKNDAGQPLIRNVKINDKVLLNSHPDLMAIDFDGEKCIIVRETELIGKFVEEQIVN